MSINYIDNLTASLKQDIDNTVTIHKIGHSKKIADNLLKEFGPVEEDIEDLIEQAKFLEEQKTDFDSNDFVPSDDPISLLVDILSENNFDSLADYYKTRNYIHSLYNKAVFDRAKLFIRNCESAIPSIGACILHFNDLPADEQKRLMPMIELTLAKARKCVANKSISKNVKAELFVWLKAVQHEFELVTTSTCNSNPCTTDLPVYSRKKGDFS